MKNLQLFLANSKTSRSIKDESHQRRSLKAEKMSDFECLFQSAISPTTTTLNELTKFVSVDRKRPDGVPFLQVRMFRFTPNGYKATSEGISLSQHQTNMLMELGNNVLTLSEPFLGSRYLSPPGVHNLSFQYNDNVENCWVVLNQGGKQLLFLRKKSNQEGVKGLALNLDEYLTLKESFNVVGLLMSPLPQPKDAEIVKSLAYEICSLIRELVLEDCVGCVNNYSNQLGHTCLNPDAEQEVALHFEEAAKRVNLSRVMHNAKFLHSVLKCETPLPSEEEVKKYLQNPDWYYGVKKIEENPYHSILTSFIHRTQDE